LGSASVPAPTGTRIKVVEIVLDRLAHGSDAEEIHRRFPSLTLGQVHSALAYYYDHQEEVDQYIVIRLRKVGEIESRLRDSTLSRKLKALKNQP
jgi:uncharacterized protein (DUF433 family)